MCLFAVFQVAGQKARPLATAQELIKIEQDLSRSALARATRMELNSSR